MNSLQPTLQDADDLRNMGTALVLARRGLGNVWPNPAVGCLLVREDENNRVVGRGWTRAGGRPHAEAEALRQAEELARGATAYVTLEPCDHHGKTPPCSQALIDAGLKRAVVAVEDPDPRVSGRGLARLEAAGVEVVRGLGEEEAAEINAGFFFRIRKGRPLVTLKVASTLDGRIATHTGDSKWITGKQARAWAHMLRAENDAIVVGSNTALADDPQLTCRLPGLGDRQPVRIVIGARLNLPLAAGLVRTAMETPTWIVTVASGDPAHAEAYRKAGVKLIEVDADESGHPNPAQVLRELGRLGLTRIMVEGGGRLCAALLKAGLVDRLAWFRSPKVIGGNGVPAAAAFGIDAIGQAPAFVRDSLEEVKGDHLETYHKKA